MLIKHGRAGYGGVRFACPASRGLAGTWLETGGKDETAPLVAVGADLATEFQDVGRVGKLMTQNSPMVGA